MQNDTHKYLVVADAYGDHVVVASAATYREAISAANIYFARQHTPKRMSKGVNNRMWDLGQGIIMMERSKYEEQYN